VNLSVIAPFSESPLEILIMAPTFNSDKQMSLGTDHERMEGEVWWRA